MKANRERVGRAQRNAWATSDTFPVDFSSQKKFTPPQFELNNNYTTFKMLSV